MTEVNIFEQASRAKLRFVTTKGYCGVEDLWDLPLTSKVKANLNDIAIALHNAVKQDEVSFVTPVSKSETLDKLRFDVVKYVIDVKMAENEVARNQKALKDKKQKLMSLIADKKDDADRNKSLEELEAELAAM